MERYTKSLAKEAVSGYCAVAKKHGMTPSQLALAWCKGRWNVTSTIIGATKMEQLKVCAPVACNNDDDSNDPFSRVCAAASIRCSY